MLKIPISTLVLVAVLVPQGNAKAPTRVTLTLIQGVTHTVRLDVICGVSRVISRQEKVVNL